MKYLLPVILLVMLASCDKEKCYTCSILSYDSTHTLTQQSVQKACGDEEYIRNVERAGTTVTHNTDGTLSYDTVRCRD